MIPIFSGVMLKKVGYRNGLLITSSMVCIGQLLFVAGGYLKSFKILLLGKLIHGLGGETLYII